MKQMILGTAQIIKKIILFLFLVVFLLPLSLIISITILPARIFILNTVSIIKQEGNIDLIFCLKNSFLGLVNIAIFLYEKM